MPPDREENVAVSDFEIRDGKLEGVTEYWFVPAGKQYGIDWEAQHPPKDYAPIHGGVAYYFAGTGTGELQPGVHPLQVIELEDSKYKWHEGGTENGFMMILILPRDRTLTDLSPVPNGAKKFRGRLALYWTTREQAIDIKWTMKELQGDLMNEVRRLNTGRADQQNLLRERASKTEDVPSWFPIAGAWFLGLTLLFFMLLVVLSLFGREIPMTSRFILVALLALSVAASLTFLGGNAAAKGAVSLPFFKESPMSFAVTGGIAVFVIVLVLGYALYVR